MNPHKNMPANPRPRRSRRWWLMWLAVLVAVLAVELEIYSRWSRDLGNPPLYLADDRIEYRLAPNQAGSYRHKHYAYNRWSMRNDDLAPTRTDPNELRVLVIGDSIVNGLHKLDQSELATERAAQRLRRITGRPVTVANIAASSWGAQNQLAYIERFGTFDANVAVIVTSSHDARDLAFHRPLSETARALPFARPPAAAWEYLDHKLTRYWRKHGLGSGPVSELADANTDVSPITTAALEHLVARLRADGLAVTVIHHAERSELHTGLKVGYGQLRAAADRAGVRWVDTWSMLHLARQAKAKPFADGIHLAPNGQSLLAEVIVEAVTHTPGLNELPAR